LERSSSPELTRGLGGERTAHIRRLFRTRDPEEARLLAKNMDVDVAIVESNSYGLKRASDLVVRVGRFELRRFR
jgi:hypothetical protein